MDSPIEEAVKVIERLLEDAVPGAAEWDDARSRGVVEFTRPEWELCVKATNAARSALASLRKAAGGSQRVWWCNTNRVTSRLVDETEAAPACPSCEITTPEDTGCGWRTLLPEPGKEPR